MTAVKRGDVWIADLGEPSGHEQAFRRPCLILQTDDLSNLSTTVIVPVTTSPVGINAHRVAIPKGEGGLDRDSFALCHQIRALDMRKLQVKLGELPAERISEIESAVLFVLALP